MNEIKRNIITLISEKTGSSEEETNKIIKEFAKILKKAARDKRVTFIPGMGNVTVVLNAPFKASDTGKILNIQKAGKWHTDNKVYDTPFVHEPPDDTAISDSHSAKHHILEALETNRKSDEILERFMTVSGMPNKVLAEEIFEISPKTLSSYRKSEKDLPIRLNEQILKLEELYKKGIELFENSERFNKWLKTESYGLGNVKPIKLINSITGIDLVFEELVRIEYGTTA